MHRPRIEQHHIHTFRMDSDVSPKDGLTARTCQSPSSGRNSDRLSNCNKGIVMKRLALLCLALLLCLAVPAAAADKTGKHSEKQTQKEHIPPATSFERFSAVLPQGWTGEDQSGFHSGDNREYMLMIGKKGDTSFEAALTIFILPNLKGEDAKSLAGQSAQMQNNASAVTEKDGFWSFTGEPRSKISGGEALTRVRATPDLMLIIVSQDPKNLGAEKVFQSLVPITADAKKLFQRP